MARSTLIILAILFTLFAFVAADLDFWRDHGFTGRIHYHSNTLLSSLAIASRGEIEVDDERGEIVALEPGGYLEIRERRLTTRRRLGVRGDASGRPVYSYQVGSDRRPESEAREYLAAKLDQILSTTTIGAETRARRLAEDEGAERVLAEIDRLETNSLRSIYLARAARAPGLDADLAARIVRTAGGVVDSSARLGELLADLAESLPVEWNLTAELARAAESIASSAERANALEAVVRRRSLEATDVGVLGEVVASIPSSSVKGRLIRRLVELEPMPALVEAMLTASRSIESSAERRRVLTALSTVPDLPPELYREALDVAEEIASSSERAGFLKDLVDLLPPRPALESRYIEVASTIRSSVEQQRALAALLAARALSPPVCAEWVRSAGGVASSRVTAELLVAAAARCAAEPAVRRAFLSAVEGLPSSVDQRRSLVALVEAADLDADARSEIAAVAERAIASASERAVVLERLAVASRP